MSNKSGVGDQVLSLPKGGGDMKGIGETFSPDLHTGTGNFTIPIALPPGRNGLAPSLALSYSSGQGNGPFGFGFAISVPGVARKTSRGIPQYNDKPNVNAKNQKSVEDPDIFLLSGAEDLVPISTSVQGKITITTYRPRTEGLFAKICHYDGPRDDYWEVRSKDGLVSQYGTPDRRGDDLAVIEKPGDSALVHAFAWKLTSTVDPFGNRIEYSYVRDKDLPGGDRNGHQTYLATIGYADFGTPRQFLVNVQFTYAKRPDPFSDRRPGFEIRTTQRCVRIDVNTAAPLRSYYFEYGDDPPANGVSLLSRVRVEGHDGAAQSEELPPLDLGYGRFAPDRRRLTAVTGPDLPPVSLAHPELELADLFATGLPDLVQISAMSVRYWKNLGEGQFDRAREMKDAPAGISLGSPGVQLIDANGDGRIDLMVTAAPLAGYYPLRMDGGWAARSFQRYECAPSFDLRDPEVRLVDLDGDGVTDAIRSGARIECFFNDPEKGWTGMAAFTRGPPATFPDVSFSDKRVQFADMTGDGLQDIVLINQRRIDYWPSLGRGRWGARITMLGSPHLPEGYDPRRILIGDIDGDGVSDIVYVDDGAITIWINQSGNGFGPPIRITGTPRVTDMDSVRLVDLLGVGVRGILWTDDLGLSRAPMYFLDLTGSKKPYLLESINGHLGSTTHVTYAPSTRFYLEDQRHRETRWKTSLPFPVQVVARTEVTDVWSGGKLITEYTYHHGYWDGVEREFRGFGRVEHRDAERIALDGTPEYFSPPIETRTWFHPGPVGDTRGFVEVDFTNEFWPGDQRALDVATLPAAALPKDLPVHARREALRALRGSILRTEVYALDNGPLATRPYTVTEELHSVREESVPEAASTRQRIFFAYGLATRSTQWERGDEPMTELHFTGGHDVYGQPTFETKIAVPRRRDFRVSDPQGKPYLATHTRTDRATLDDGTRYIIDRVTRATTYEIENNGTMNAFDLAKSVEFAPGAHPIIAQVFHYYDGSAFEGLTYGTIGNYGALVRSEALVFTSAILNNVYSTLPPYLVNGVPAWTNEYPDEFRTLLAPQAGYVWRTGPNQTPGWYVVTERSQYDFHDDSAGRGLVTAKLDPLGRKTTIAYDKHYQLLPAAVTDPAELTTTVTYDERVLLPSSATDPNGNRTTYHYTPLGLVDKIVVMGKEGEAAGATAEAPSMRFIYNFMAVATDRGPISLHTIQRVWDANDAAAPKDERDRTIESVAYFDGLGRKLQTRAQAADVAFGDARFGRLDLDSPSIGRPGETSRVLVSGAEVHDNKGRVVEKFEPEFSQGFEYAPIGRGEKQLMYYDPRGRVIRTVHPDGSEDRLVHGIPADLTNPDVFAPSPWEAYSYDANDNAGRTHPTESAGYRSHWNTPSSIEVDALGRTIRSVERNPDEYITRTEYDIRGNPLRITDPLERVAFEHAYDLANRPLTTKTLDGGTKVAVIDAAGGAVEHRDAKGALTLAARDQAGRDIRLWARDAAAESITLRVRQTYGDSADSGLTREIAKGKNLLGKPYRHYDEAGVVTILACDFKGRVLEKTRQVIADSRLLSIFAAPSPAWVVRPLRVDWQPSAGTKLADYEKSLLDASVYVTSTSYDALDHVRSVLCPMDISGKRKEIRSRYDRAGALEGVDHDGSVYIERIAYDAKAHPTMVVRGNGVMTRHDYDPKTWRLARLQTVHFTSSLSLTYAASGIVFQEMRYGYDLVGNLWSIQDRTPGCGVGQQPDTMDRAFVYEPIYRLSAATGRESATPLDEIWSAAPRSVDATKTRLYSENYVYDKAGNLTQLKHGSQDGAFVRKLALAAGTNRLSELTIGQTRYGYTYDSCGNLTGEAESRRFAWDYADRMRAFVTQAGTSEPSVYAQYLYDGAGQRVVKLVRKQGGAYEVTIYIDGIFEHRRAVQGGVKVENDSIHVAAGGARVAMVRVGLALSGDTSPPVVFEVGDHLGSGHVVLDEHGALVNREEYTPYGETSFGSYGRKRYRFTGKERDEESGLNYHGARYYAPWVGRWTSCDPAGMVDGLNLFLYARSNPMNRVDKRGTDSNSTQTNSVQNGGSNNIEQPARSKTLRELDEAMPATTNLIRETAQRIEARENMQAKSTSSMSRTWDSIKATLNDIHDRLSKSFEGKLKFKTDSLEISENGKQTELKVKFGVTEFAVSDKGLSGGVGVDKKVSLGSRASAGVTAKVEVLANPLGGSDDYALGTLKVSAQIKAALAFKANKEVSCEIATKLSISEEWQVRAGMGASDGMETHNRALAAALNSEMGGPPIELRNYKPR